MTSVALVTGAAGVMGAACARELAPTVDALVLTDRAADGLAICADAIAATSPVAVHRVAGDLTDPAVVDTLAGRVADLGPLRACVQTAGLSPSMAGWREILAVDLIAVLGLLDALRPLVVPGTAAVVIASISGHLGPFDAAMDAVLDDARAPDFVDRFAAEYEAASGAGPDPGSTYRLAKRGVIRACERAAVDWGRAGGRVVSLSPGLIDTAMGRLELEHHPIKQQMAAMTPVGAGRADDETLLPGLASDIARTVAYLCSDAAAFVSGCDLRVDGGLVAAMSHPDLT